MRWPRGPRRVAGWGVNLQLTVPDGNGGAGGGFAKPQQPFAAGHPACLHGALQLARQATVTAV
jgi:organic hydroperoxide reductase OsmC/OhrA